MRASWFFATLAAIAFAVASGLGTSAIHAQHELTALDCESDAYAPADGTFLSALVPHSSPCADLRDELTTKSGYRQLQAGAAILASACFLILAVRRRREDPDEPIIPPSRAA